MSRTRIKICGLTRPADVALAVALGADAVGFVRYRASPRYVELRQLESALRELPAFVTPVLLFVNATEAEVRAALDVAPNALLQFHGDETESDCARFGRSYVRAVRMGEGVDLLDCAARFASASALLADAPAEGYGGGGKTFDWSRVPPPAARPKLLVLAGGLTPENVGAAIGAVRPYAVDVASGVEERPGVKSAEKLKRFFAAVAGADAELNPR
ncbi:MAG: phosphoribosylanthranilate isomerase [Burkholderiaceae bacterium]